MPPKKKPEAAPIVFQTPAPVPKRKKDGGMNSLIVIGLLLVLFAGTVVLLLSSPQGKQFLTQEGAKNEESGEKSVPATNQATNANVGAPAPVLNAMGLPEGGEVALVNSMDESNTSIASQKIVWRATSGDTVLVEDVRALLPGLSQYQALGIFARPTSDTRVYFVQGCAGACDGAPHNIVAFDPKFRAFIPLLNAPNIAYDTAALSQNQHHIVYVQGIDTDGEARELWVYDFTKDQATRLLTLPAGESLSSALSEFDGAPVTAISWVDDATISYKVYRAGGRVPGTERPRTEVATRTVALMP